MFDQFHSKSEIRKKLCFDIHMAPVVKLSKRVSGWKLSQHCGMWCLRRHVCFFNVFTRLHTDTCIHTGLLRLRIGPD